MKKVEVVKLAADSNYSPHRKYMFGFHPHGILFLGPSTVVFNIDKYPNIFKNRFTVEIYTFAYILRFMHYTNLIDFLLHISLGSN